MPQISQKPPVSSCWMATELREHLVSELENLPAYFLPNELAFLAATQGVETPLRDKLAFRLHETLGALFRIERNWQSWLLPGAATLALKDFAEAPRVVLDIRSAMNPVVFAASSTMLMQSLKALRGQVPVFTEWYHLFVVPLPAFSLELTPLQAGPAFVPIVGPFTAFAEAWQAQADSVVRHWLDQLLTLAVDSLGFDRTRISLHALQAGTYYFYSQKIWMYLCGPFTSVDTIYQLDSWKPVI